MKKGLIVGIIGAAALAIATAVAFFLTQRSTEPESVRSIKVIDLGGTCTVLRNGETLTVGKDMDLYTDDVFGVSEDGFARIRLDDDKFLYLDAGAIIDISATGDQETSDTLIFIEQGAMMTEVKNKLSPESSFTIATANTSMHITGTIVATEVIPRGDRQTLEEMLEGMKGNAKGNVIIVNNAVLEGTATVRAYEGDATGNVIVAAEASLAAGEGNSFSGESVMDKSMRERLSGKLNTLHLTAGSSRHDFDNPQFSESFLNNVEKVISADAKDEAVEPNPYYQALADTRSLLVPLVDEDESVSGMSMPRLSWDKGSTESTEPKTAVDRSKQATTAVAAVETPKKDTHRSHGWMDPGIELPPLPLIEELPSVIEEDDIPSVTNRPKEEEKKEEEKKEEEKRDDTITETGGGSTTTETDDGSFFNGSYISYEGLRQTIIKNGNSVILHLIFCRKDANGEWQEYSSYRLPTKIPAGNVLPGIETPDVTPDIFIDVADENNQYAGYVFTGWYKSEAGAGSSDAQDKIEKVPDGTGNLTVYAGIAEEPNHDVSENDPINAVSGNE